MAAGRLWLILRGAQERVPQDDGLQFLVLSTNASFLIHGIMIFTVREHNPRAAGERIP
jgi:hypothetical protein